MKRPFMKLQQKELLIRIQNLFKFLNRKKENKLSPPITDTALHSSLLQKHFPEPEI